jgi:hypothetical protein
MKREFNFPANLEFFGNYLKLKNTSLISFPLIVFPREFFFPLIFSRGNYTAQTSVTLQGTKLVFRAQVAQNVDKRVQTNSIPLGTWVHVACTCQGRDLVVYLDGV